MQVIHHMVHGATLINFHPGKYYLRLLLLFLIIKDTHLLQAVDNDNIVIFCLPIDYLSPLC